VFSADVIRWVQQFSSPALDAFFHAVTNLGHEYAYILILLVVYWCVDRRIGHRLALVFLSSMWLNGYLKEIFQTPRPSPDDGVRVLVHEASFSFPSGHAQGSMTLWGFLALSLRRPWLWAASAILILLVGVSRIYLGAHFLGDVVGGWLIGALVLAVFSAAGAAFGRLSLSRSARLALAILVPLLLVPLYQTGPSLQLLGVLMGWMGSDVFALEAIAYRERASAGRQAAKVLLGLLGVAALLALHSFVPEGLFEALGWALISLWITVGAPILFVRLGLSGEGEGPQRGIARADAWKGLRRLLKASGVVALLIAALAVVASPDLEDEYEATLAGGLAPARPAVIAHRGGAGIAPENTLLAFAAGLAYSEALELDVRLTADGQLVVIHDETVDRTTSGTGRVRELTVAQLKELDAGYWFTPDGVNYPYRGRGVEIPLLSEVLDAFPDVSLIIEIKDEDEEAARALAALLAEKGRAERVVVGSFNDRVIAAFRRASPQTPTTAAMGEAVRFLVLSRLGLDSLVRVPWQSLSVPPRYGPLPVISSGLIEAAHRKGVPVHAWTINDLDEARRLAALGVDGIITDYPDRILERQ